MNAFKFIFSLTFLVALSFGTYAQNDSPCEKKFGLDSVKTLEQISIYQEFYKQKEYVAAYPAWRYVFENAPCARQNTHIQGVNIIKYLIGKTSNEARKERLIDTLLMIYDVRAKSFPGNEGSDFTRQAIDILKYRKDNIKAIESIEKGMEIGGDKMPYFSLSRYFTLILQERYIKPYKARYPKGAELTVEENEVRKVYRDSLKSKVVDVYIKLFRIANFNIVDRTQKIKDYTIAVDTISDAKQKAKMQKKLDRAVKELAAYEKALSSMNKNLSGTVTKNCKDVKKFLEAKYRANPDNENLETLVYRLMLSKKCTDDSLFEEILEIRHKRAPSSETAFVLGRKFQKKEDFDAAEKYFIEAIDLAPADTLKADYTYSLANLYKKKGAKSEARKTAKEAAKLKPNWGKPYILIGDLYASSAGACGGGFEGQTVYWPAIDKYQYAKSIDPSVTEDAQKRINKYSGYFPLKEDCFFRSLKDGDAYTVKCWIQEGTTVRTKK